MMYGVTWRKRLSIPSHRSTTRRRYAAPGRAGIRWLQAPKQYRFPSPATLRLATLGSCGAASAVNTGARLGMGDQVDQAPTVSPGPELPRRASVSRFALISLAPYAPLERFLPGSAHPSGRRQPPVPDRPLHQTLGVQLEALASLGPLRVPIAEDDVEPALVVLLVQVLVRFAAQREHHDVRSQDVHFQPGDHRRQAEEVAVG